MASSFVTGVVTSRFDVDIRGSGWVFGVEFRPGGLVAHRRRSGAGLGGPDLNRGIVPDDVAQHWPVSTPTVTRAGGSRRRRPRWAAYLIAWTPAMVRCSRSSRTCWPIGRLVSVAQVEQRHHVTSRTLQRWFVHYVGWGRSGCWPATGCTTSSPRSTAGMPVRLTELAHRYGWYDQPHFTDFDPCGHSSQPVPRRAASRIHDMT